MSADILPKFLANPSLTLSINTMCQLKTFSSKKLVLSFYVLEKHAFHSSKRYALAKRLLVKKINDNCSKKPLHLIGLKGMQKLTAAAC